MSFRLLVAKLLDTLPLDLTRSDKFERANVLEQIGS